MIPCRPGFGLILGLGVGLLIGGCSDSEERATKTRPVLSVFEARETGEDEADAISRNAEEGDPVVEGVDFSPMDPVGRESLRAIVEVDGPWTSMQFQWEHNGEAFGPNAAEVVLPDLARGDEILVRVTPYQGSRAGSTVEASRRVLNERPHVRNLSLERVESDDSDGAERWRVVVLAEDPDEDELEIEYQWSVNGRESDVEDAIYPAGQLQRGDRLEVRVRAYDGRLWSPPTHSGEIEIGNAPPSIVSVPPRPDAAGFFQYAIRAEDPDDDSGLRFALKAAPRGMQIDGANGIVTWQPAPDQTGRHPVEVVVRDGRGGEAFQSFSLVPIREAGSEANAPSPASPR